MKVYTNNEGLEFTVIEIKGRDRLVHFTKSGSTRWVYQGNMASGKVKDLYHPKVFGIGYVGEFEKVPYWKQAKQLWQNMMKRCYSDADKNGYKGKVTVDARWHCFANFLTDLPSLEGFSDWLVGGMQLDKDMSGTKVYSVNTCRFLSEFENKSIQPNYRTGKTFDKETRTWIN